MSKFQPYPGSEKNNDKNILFDTIDKYGKYGEVREVLYRGTKFLDLSLL
jgi:hypothetical protein